MSKKNFNAKKIREEVGAVREAENNRDEEMFHRDEKPSRNKTRNCNDPSWYAQNETLLRDSASFAFANFTGASYALDPTNIYADRHNDQVDTNSLMKRSVPGVMSIKLAPTVGISKNNLSAVNIAARNMYTFVRHMNSGHTNYDSPNLMMYILAANSAYSYYSWLMRTYGIAMYYSVFNRYLPKALIENSIGIDYEDLIGNLANYRFRLNRCATKLATFCVPATMSYTARTIWIYSRIFADSPNPKAQLYMYNPEYFWRYDEVNNTLTAVGLHDDFASQQTFGKHLSNLESMIDAISESEDFNIMSGDILKAFGADKLVKLPLLEDGYQIAPVFDREVLDQIQNTTFMGEISNVDITENMDTGALQFDPVFTLPQGTMGYRLNKMYNTAMDRTDPASVMVGTRLANIASSEDIQAKKTTLQLEYCGSEVATKFEILTFKYSMTSDNWISGIMRGYTNMAVLPTPNANNRFNIEDLLKLQEAVSAFDYHPLINYWRVDDAGSGTQFYSFGTTLDVDWYAILNVTDLQKMHDTAIISEFNVPAMGAYSQVN